MKASELINDLITATLQHEDCDYEVEIEDIDEPVVVVHDNKIIITQSIHG